MNTDEKVYFDDGSLTVTEKIIEWSDGSALISAVTAVSTQTKKFIPKGPRRWDDKFVSTLVAVTAFGLFCAFLSPIGALPIAVGVWVYFYYFAMKMEHLQIVLTGPSLREVCFEDFVQVAGKKGTVCIPKKEATFQKWQSDCLTFGYPEKSFSNDPQKGFHYYANLSCPRIQEVKDTGTYQKIKVYKILFAIREAMADQQAKQGQQTPPPLQNPQ